MGDSPKPSAAPLMSPRSRLGAVYDDFARVYSRPHVLFPEEASSATSMFCSSNANDSNMLEHPNGKKIDSGSQSCTQSAAVDEPRNGDDGLKEVQTSHQPDSMLQTLHAKEAISSIDKDGQSIDIESSQEVEPSRSSGRMDPADEDHTEAPSEGPNLEIRAGPPPPVLKGAGSAKANNLSESQPQPKSNSQQCLESSSNQSGTNTTGVKRKLSSSSNIRNQRNRHTSIEDERLSNMFGKPFANKAAELLQLFWSRRCGERDLCTYIETSRHVLAGFENMTEKILESIWSCGKKGSVSMALNWLEGITWSIVNTCENTYRCAATTLNRVCEEVARAWYHALCALLPVHSERFSCLQTPSLVHWRITYQNYGQVPRYAEGSLRAIASTALLSAAASANERDGVNGGIREFMAANGVACNSDRQLYLKSNPDKSTGPHSVPEVQNTQSSKENADTPFAASRHGVDALKHQNPAESTHREEVHEQAGKSAMRLRAATAKLYSLHRNGTIQLQASTLRALAKSTAIAIATVYPHTFSNANYVSDVEDDYTDWLLKEETALTKKNDDGRVKEKEQEKGMILEARAQFDKKISRKPKGRVSKTASEAAANSHRDTKFTQAAVQNDFEYSTNSRENGYAFRSSHERGDGTGGAQSIASDRSGNNLHLDSNTVYVETVFGPGTFGIELGHDENLRASITDLNSGGQAQVKHGSVLKIGMVLVSVGKIDVTTYGLHDIVQAMGSADRPVTLGWRKKLGTLTKLDAGHLSSTNAQSTMEKETQESYFQHF